MQLGALVHVDRRPGAGDEGEDGIAPALLAERLAQRGARSPGGKSRPGVLATSWQARTQFSVSRSSATNTRGGSSRTTAQATTVPISDPAHLSPPPISDPAHLRPRPSQTVPGATSAADQNPRPGRPASPAGVGRQPCPGVGGPEVDRVEEAARPGGPQGAVRLGARPWELCREDHEGVVAAGRHDVGAPEGPPSIAT